MDVGHSNGWRLDEVVPADELVGRDRRASWPLEPADPTTAARSPDRWRYVDGGGEFGVISSVTQPFCRDCTRARLSAEGKLYTCLFAVDGPRPPGAAPRRGATDADLTRRRSPAIWPRRGDRYSELRSAATVDAAQDRDVRDGRLSGPRPSIRRLLHSLSTAADNSWIRRRRRSRGVRG